MLFGEETPPAECSKPVKKIFSNGCPGFLGFSGDGGGRGGAIGVG